MSSLLARPLRLERIRSLVRTLAVASGAALALFHGCVFVVQAAEGRLEDPWLLVQWLLAAGLVAALAAIRRGRGGIWNRQALAVWVLAALLHGPSVTTDFFHPIHPLALSETASTSILESLVSVSAFAATLWMLAGLLGLRAPHARLCVRVLAAGSLDGIFSSGFSPQYYSRPPPQRA
ncbi:MAG: hypothetical protein ABI983_03715 [Acidobacteriota bacterium]